jgi:hypothetical protein
MMKFILFPVETSVLFKIPPTSNNINKVLIIILDGYLELDQKIIYLFLIEPTDFPTLYNLPGLYNLPNATLKYLVPGLILVEGNPINIPRFPFRKNRKLSYLGNRERGLAADGQKKGPTLWI